MAKVQERRSCDYCRQKQQPCSRCLSLNIECTKDPNFRGPAPQKNKCHLKSLHENYRNPLASKRNKKLKADCKHCQELGVTCSRTHPCDRCTKANIRCVPSISQSTDHPKDEIDGDTVDMEHLSGSNDTLDPENLEEKPPKSFLDDKLKSQLQSYFVNDLELQLPSLYDFRIPHLSGSRNKLIYLEILHRFNNYPVRFFDRRFSAFKFFPFDSSRVIRDIRPFLFQNSGRVTRLDISNASVNQQVFFSRLEHLALHYVDCLHAQFYAALAIGSSILDHHQVSQQFTRHASIITTNLAQTLSFFPRKPETLNERLRPVLASIQATLDSFLKSQLHSDILTSITQLMLANTGDPSIQKSLTDSLKHHHPFILPPSSEVDPTTHPAYAAIVSEFISMLLRTQLPAAFRYTPGELMELCVAVEFQRAHWMLQIVEEASWTRQGGNVRSFFESAFFKSIFNSPLSPLHSLLLHPSSPTSYFSSSYTLEKCILLLEDAVYARSMKFSGVLSEASLSAWANVEQNPPSLSFREILEAEIKPHVCLFCTEVEGPFAEEIEDQLVESFEAVLPHTSIPLLLGLHPLPPSSPPSFTFVRDMVKGRHTTEGDAFLLMVNNLKLTTAHCQPQTSTLILRSLTRLTTIQSHLNEIGDPVEVLRNVIMTAILPSALNVEPHPASQQHEEHQTNGPARNEFADLCSSILMSEKTTTVTPFQAHRGIEQFDSFFLFLLDPTQALILRLSSLLDFIVITLKAIAGKHILNLSSTMSDTVKAYPAVKITSRQSLLIFRLLYFAQHLLIHGGLSPIHHVASIRTTVQEGSKTPKFTLTFVRTWANSPAYTPPSSPFSPIPANPFVLNILSSERVWMFEQEIKRSVIKQEDAMLVSQTEDSIETTFLLQTKIQHIKTRKDSALFLDTPAPFLPFLSPSQHPLQPSLENLPEWRHGPEDPSTFMQAVLAEHISSVNREEPSVPDFLPDRDLMFFERVLSTLQYINRTNTLVQHDYELPPSFSPFEESSNSPKFASEHHNVHFNAVMAVYSYFFGSRSTSLAFCNCFTFGSVRLLHETHFLCPQTHSQDLLFLDQILKLYIILLFDSATSVPSNSIPSEHMFTTVREDHTITSELFSYSLLCFLVLLQTSANHPSANLIQPTIFICCESVSNLVTPTSDPSVRLHGKQVLPSFISASILEVVSEVERLFHGDTKTEMLGGPDSQEAQSLYLGEQTLPVHGSYSHIFNKRLTSKELSFNMNELAEMKKDPYGEESDTDEKTKFDRKARKETPATYSTPKVLRRRRPAKESSDEDEAEHEAPPAPPPVVPPLPPLPPLPPTNKLASSFDSSQLTFPNFTPSAPPSTAPTQIPQPFTVPSFPRFGDIPAYQGTGLTPNYPAPSDFNQFYGTSPGQGQFNYQSPYHTPGPSFFGSSSDQTIAPFFGGLPTLSPVSASMQQYSGAGQTLQPSFSMASSPYSFDFLSPRYRTPET